MIQQISDIPSKLRPGQSFALCRILAWAGTHENPKYYILWLRYRVIQKFLPPKRFLRWFSKVSHLSTIIVVQEQTNQTGS